MNRLFLLIFLCSIPGYVLFGQQFNQEIMEHREAYKNHFLTSSSTPLKKKDLKFLRFFEPDSNYCVVAKFIKDTDPVPFDMLTSSGITKIYVAYGVLEFEILGKTQHLTIYRSLAFPQHPLNKNHGFIPFKDLSNGKLSYGGGRYLDIKLNEIENELYSIDFNKAYNPYCAFSAGYSCPIPPKANHLSIEINAGEQTFAKK